MLRVKLFQCLMMFILVASPMVQASISDEILDSDDIFTRMEELDMEQRLELFQDLKRIETVEVDLPDSNLKHEWKCKESDLLVCLYKLGREGIYDLSAEQFFSYFPKSEYELIEDHFDFLRISKQSRFVQLEFHLKDIQSVKFSLLGEEYPRVAIKHLGKMVIEQTDMSKLQIVSYPKWATRLMPYEVRKALVDVDENMRIKLSRWSTPSIDRRVIVQNIYLHEIEFVKDQLQGFGSFLDQISVVNMETFESHEKIYLLKGKSFLLPTIKGLRKNTLFKSKLSSNEI